MKLVLYSGGQQRSNQLLHQELSDLVGQSKKRKSFTYIPYCHDYSQVYFNRAVKRYKRFGFKTFRYLNIDQPHLKKEVKEAFSSDVIYLAGGNTFYLLHHLRKSNLVQPLRQFAQKGGVIAGLSAGAILLTPSIFLAGYPSYNRDENEVGLINEKALGLVPFEFYPHYVNSKRDQRSMSLYSKRIDHPLYACADGSGIVINGTQTSFFGKTYLFQKGHSVRLFY